MQIGELSWKRGIDLGKGKIMACVCGCPGPVRDVEQEAGE